MRIEAEVALIMTPEKRRQLNDNRENKNKYEHTQSQRLNGNSARRMMAKDTTNAK